jgi:hypothetical protein
MYGRRALYLPKKFFDIIDGSGGILGGTLKIHRSHGAVNKALKEGRAKAVVTHRRLDDACFSYWRMLGSRHSSFYSPEQKRGFE